MRESGGISDIDWQRILLTLPYNARVRIFYGRLISILVGTIMTNRSNLFRQRGMNPLGLLFLIIVLLIILAMQTRLKGNPRCYSIVYNA